MKKFFFLPLMLLLTSCFYSEMRVEYAVEGCDEKKFFCIADYPYTQEEVGDTVVPYHRYFIMEIEDNDKYGIYLPKEIKEEVSAENVALVDEYGENVVMTVMLKKGLMNSKIELNKKTFEPSSVGIVQFFITVQTPSIQSYEIEFRFEKKDGTAHVFNFRVNQERKKKWFFIPVELFRM